MKEVYSILSIIAIIFIVFCIIIKNDENNNVNFNQEVKEGLNDNIVIKISDFCSTYKTNIGKITCVHNFVKNSGYFNYTKLKEIRTPDILINSSGDCKSWDVFYRTILTKMNIKNRDIFSDNHVFTLAYNNDFYCIIDQTSLSCVNLDLNISNIENISIEEEI